MLHNFHVFLPTVPEIIEAFRGLHSFNACFVTSEVSSLEDVEVEQIAPGDPVNADVQRTRESPGMVWCQNT